MRILIVFALFLLTGCHNEEGKTAVRNTQLSTPSRESQHERKMADLSTILSRKEVPVLCYHNIRHFRPGESDRMKSYTVTPEAFAEQMKALSDSGYQTILPGELYDYLVHGASLPSKPIMISFDDTDAEQYSIGATEMNKYGFKGVYFVMTISINRPRYMKEAEIRNLSDSGHNISSHTWDHHMVTKYTGADWDSQFVKPKLRLEKITGKPVEYFAYPFGLWNKEAISELKTRGYKLAFILSTKRDSTEPLHTVRRMIVPGTWSTPGMMKAIRTTFNK
jgi:peptidoglycan/xylan/chitin deacetylase (PgdA/CDA1 family)